MAGLPKIPCIERIAAASNDAATAPDRQRRGRLDAQLRPERRDRLPVRRTRSHYHNAYLTTALPVGALLRPHQVPVQHRRLPQGRQPGDQPAGRLKLGEYGYAPADDGARPRADVPEVDRPGAEGAGEGDGGVQPGGRARRRSRRQASRTRARRCSTRRAIRSSSTIHVIGGWSDWVASLQIITRNLQDVGIDANVKLEPDWGAWQPNAMSTKFVTLLWNYGGGDSHAVLVLLLALRPVPEPRRRRRRLADRQLGALLERRRARRS